MPKLKSIEDLKAYAKTVSVERPGKTVLSVGTATCGIAAGGREAIDALNDAIKANHLKDIEVVETGCLGFCYAEPLVEVRAPGAASVYYAGVTEEIAKKIIEDHIVRGLIVEAALLSKEVPR